MTARPFSATRNIRLLYASALIADLLPFLPIWIVYLTDFRGLTLGQVGLMEAFFWAVAIATEIPSGAFSDRFGRRPTFIAGNVIQAAGIALFALAGNFPLLLASYVLWAGGIAFHSGNLEAYLFEALAAEGREDDFAAAIGRVSAISIVAVSIGAVGGALLAGTTDMRAPIFLSAGLFLAAVPVVAALQEPPRARRATPLSYTQTLREGARALRTNPPVALMILFGMAFAIAATAGMLLDQPFLLGHGVPVAAFGLFIAPVQLAAAAGALVAYRLPRAIGFNRSMALLFVLPTVVLVLMGVIDHVAAFAGFAITRTVFAMRMPLAIDYINRRTPSDVRATVLSVQPLGQSIVLAVAAPLVGLIAERSISNAFVTIGAVTFVLAGAAYLLWLRADRRAAPAASEETPAG